MVATSPPSGSARIIKSRKPSCLRSHGRILYSIRLANNLSESGFKRTETFLANMSLPPSCWAGSLRRANPHDTPHTLVVRFTSQALQGRGLEFSPSRPAIGNADFLGHPNQFGQRIGAHLSHQLAAMDLHGSLTRSNFSGDLF